MCVYIYIYVSCVCVYIHIYTLHTYSIHMCCYIRSIPVRIALPEPQADVGVPRQPSGSIMYYCYYDYC